MSGGGPLFVDVVIPFRRWDAWTAECLQATLALEPPCQRITLVPDEPLPAEVWENIRAMPNTQNVREVVSGPVNPARKRNAAMEHNGADIFGFVDSDARPWSDWLAQGLPFFEDSRVAIVGGPNLTPPEDHPLQKACGDIMASPLGMGAAYIRHVPVSRREVTELPTCNMLARNLEWLRFRPELDTSEDMEYCALARARGYRVIYDPAVRVDHHRRFLGVGFWRQFRAYGLYQGQRFAWHRLWRAAPLGLLVYLLALVLGLFVAPGWWWIWTIPLAIYLCGIAMESIRLTRGRLRGWLTWVAFPWAHAAYGIGYFQGLLSRMGAAPQSVQAKEK
ncbi:MAG: glycosyltransferase family 2 protein [Kiritimatiellia bacterium]|jgi:GT2 family glycosyltransferase